MKRSDQPPQPGYGGAVRSQLADAHLDKSNKDKPMITITPRVLTARASAQLKRLLALL